MQKLARCPLHTCDSTNHGHQPRMAPVCVHWAKRLSGIVLAPDEKLDIPQIENFIERSADMPGNSAENCQFGIEFAGIGGFVAAGVFSFFAS